MNERPPEDTPTTDFAPVHTAPLIQFDDERLARRALSQSDEKRSPSEQPCDVIKFPTRDRIERVINYLEEHAPEETREFRDKIAQLHSENTSGDDAAESNLVEYTIEQLDQSLPDLSQEVRILDNMHSFIRG